MKKPEIITHKVWVNAQLSNTEVIVSTGKKRNIIRSVLVDMPKCEKGYIKLIFFKVGRSLSEVDLSKEYDLRGLKPADPYSICVFNAKNPNFSNKHPHGTHWKDKDDNWCFILFDRKNFVYIAPDADGWSKIWWFVGVKM